MSTSKTARASMVTGPVTKTVIPDEVYIKNLRNDVASGLYVAQEGAKALLRAYDKLQAEFDTLLKNSTEQVVATAEVTTQLEASKARIVELEAEIAAAQEIFGATKFSERPPCESKEPDWPSALNDPGLRNEGVS